MAKVIIKRVCNSVEAFFRLHQFKVSRGENLDPDGRQGILEELRILKGDIQSAHPDIEHLKDLIAKRYEAKKYKHVAEGSYKDLEDVFALMYEADDSMASRHLTLFKQNGTSILVTTYMKDNMNVLQ